MTTKMNKKKILVDLDVITVGIWKKRDERRILSKKAMERIENHEFYVITPSPMLNLVDKWKNKELAGEIRDFYSKNTDYFMEEAELFEKLKEKGIDINSLLKSLSACCIKDEDMLLVVICAIENAQLVTFNRKHLKSNQNKIKEVLDKYGLTADILYPNEI